MSKVRNDELKTLIDKHGGKDLKSIRRYLKRVVEGKEFDHRMTPQGDVVEVPVSAQVRVQASRALKELMVDKILADVKDTQKHEHKFDLAEAVQDVGRKKEAELEKKLESEGKLKKIGS